MNTIFWLVEIGASWIEVYFSVFFIMRHFKVDPYERKNWSCLFATIMAIIFALFNRFTFFSLFQTLFFIVSLVWAVFRYVQKDMRKIIFHAAFSLLLIGLCDVLTILMINSLLGYQSNEWLNEIGSTRFFAIIISKTLFLLVITSIYSFSKGSRLIKRNYFILGSLIELVIIIGLFLLGKHTYVNGQNNFTILTFLGIIVVLFVGIIRVKQIIEKQEQTMKVNLLQMRNEMLEKSLKDTEEVYSFFRKSVHDYKHKILLINQYVSQDRIEDLKAFLIEENKYINHELFYQKTGNTVVDTILNIKKHQANLSGITFSFTAFLPEHMIVKDTHMAALLGNVIDNALQAEKNMEHPWVDIKMEVKADVLLIKVDNGYIGPKIDFSKTRKERKAYHGIGLQSVRDILEEYDGNLHLTQLADKVRCIITIPLS